VVGRALQFDDIVSNAGDRLHDADRVAGLLENWPLLDVEFDKGVEIVPFRLRDSLRVETNGAHRVADTLVDKAARLLRIFRRDGAGDGARAPELCGRKAAGFLFTEGEGFKGSLRLAELLFQRAQRNQGGKRPQDAIVTTARLL
jgi:hypothetical protein